MNTLKIGEKIKKLRKAHDMTQEKLADYLCVSFQAISKWECGSASPDISLLVPLSRLFGVTIDELFDNSPQNIDRRREKLKKAYDETWQSGDVKKRYEISKTAVNEYPGDFEFSANLALAEWCYGIHCFAGVPTEREKLLENSVKHAELVIENTEDETLKVSALRTVIYSLNDLGRKETALEYAKMAGDEELITMCLTGEDKIKRKQEALNRVFSDLVGRLSVPGNRIEELDIADTIIKTMIPDENYLFYTDELMHNEIWRARHYAEHGMLEKAISALKQAHEYALEYDEICRSGCVKKYTCPVFDHLEFDFQKLIRSGMSSLCDDFVEYLGLGWFDSIRNTDEFSALYLL